MWSVGSDVIVFDVVKSINPLRGLKVCGHIVGTSGDYMSLDLYKQVTDKSRTYQVKGAKNGTMLNISDSAMMIYLFIVVKE